MDKNEVAANLASRLLAAETAIDEAMFETTKLLEGFVQARRDLGLTIFSGEIAQNRIVETVAALGEAHKTIMAAHGSLAEMGRKLNVDTAAEYNTNTSSNAVEHVKTTLRVAS